MISEDHVIMMLKIQRCVTEINYSLKYINRETKIRNCNTIFQFFLYF